jgi:hypothetical protein
VRLSGDKRKLNQPKAALQIIRNGHPDLSGREDLNLGGGVCAPTPPPTELAQFLLAPLITSLYFSSTASMYY